jgi:hypothetical protein
MRWSPYKTPPLPPSISTQRTVMMLRSLASASELEEAELQVLVDEAEQASALAADFATAKERKATRDALSAVHDARMKALRERLDGSKRAKSSPLPLLTESRVARMDKGVNPKP